MLIVFSYGLFISCVTCDFIISLYCISFTGRVFFYSFIVSSFIVYCVLCMRVCVCVYGLLPDSNKDLICTQCRFFAPKCSNCIPHPYFTWKFDMILVQQITASLRHGSEDPRLILW